MTKWLVVGIVLLGWVPMAAAQGRPAAREARLIAHGRYLVQRVAMCGDCHSPHNARGEVVPGRELEGSRLEFHPMHPVPGWFSETPAIAGLQGWTRREAVRFLMTGLDRSNKHAGPPMPRYRLSRHDAESVVAYLKSLPAGK